MTNKIISVVIPNYNRNTLLEETLNSVIVQTIGTELLDIIVVDDNSELENPLEVISKFNSFGVKLVRNNVNLGQMKNLNKCLALALCTYVHLLHSDDTIEPTFYFEILKQFESFPDSGAVFTRNFYINDSGQITGVSPIHQEKTGIIGDWKNKLYLEQLIQTPSIVVKKSIYNKVGDFNENLKTCEDWEMWTRISDVSTIVYHNQILASYRSTSISNSATTSFDGTFFNDLSNLQKVFYLQHRDKELYIKSRILYGNFFIRNLNELLNMRLMWHIRLLNYLPNFKLKIKYIIKLTKLKTQKWM
jgi:glycosyltransferase involved in cell wall biosynthesis